MGPVHPNKVPVKIQWTNPARPEPGLGPGRWRCRSGPETSLPPLRCWDRVIFSGPAVSMFRWERLKKTYGNGETAISVKHVKRQTWQWEIRFFLYFCRDVTARIPKKCMYKWRLPPLMISNMPQSSRAGAGGFRYNVGQWNCWEIPVIWSDRNLPLTSNSEDECDQNSTQIRMKRCSLTELDTSPKTWRYLTRPQGSTMLWPLGGGVWKWIGHQRVFSYTICLVTPGC